MKTHPTPRTNSEFLPLCYALPHTTKATGAELYLLAQIQPTAELIEYTKKGQKNFTSIEVNPNFADTGEAYLVGLAVTDMQEPYRSQAKQSIY